MQIDALLPMQPVACMLVDIPLRGAPRIELDRLPELVLSAHTGGDVRDNPPVFSHPCHTGELACGHVHLRQVDPILAHSPQSEMTSGFSSVIDSDLLHDLGHKVGDPREGISAAYQGA